MSSFEYTTPVPLREAFGKRQTEIKLGFTLFLLFYFRLTITASCPMNLQYFPMDRQLCNIEIESCKYRENSKSNNTNQ